MIKSRFMKLSILTGLLALLLALLCISASAAGPEAKTEEQYIFSIEGYEDKFILLDSDDEGYFILTYSLYGSHVFDPDNTGEFDLEDENNAAYWLNNDFILYGNGDKKLPQPIIDNLVNKTWDIEKGYSVNIPAKKVTCKLTFMSTTEWSKYATRFGYGDDVSNKYWYLRSPSTNQYAPHLITITYTDRSSTNVVRNTDYYGIRPVFYLNKDFFKKVKLKTDDKYLGDTVKGMLRREHIQSDLSSLYDSSQLYQIFESPIKPSVKDIEILGYPGSGCVVSVIYTFVSETGDKDAASVIRWLKGKEKNGDYIYMGEGKEYKLTDADVGYYIKAEVNPIGTEGILGKAKASVPLPAVVQPDHKPLASNVYIKGEVGVGERLILNYNYSDGNMDRERDTIFVWERSKDGVEFKAIDGADSVNYIPTKDDVGYVLRASVTPKNRTSIGSKVYTPVTKAVYEKPSAVITKVGTCGYCVTGEYTYSGTYDEDGTTVYWESAHTADGNYVRLSESGENKIHIAGLENRYMRFVVIPRDKEGNEGSKVCSEPVYIQGYDSQVEFAAATLTEDITGGGSIYGLDIMPAMISFDVVTNDTAAVSVESNKYDVYTVVSKGRVKCTLVLKNKAKLAIGDNELVRITAGKASVTNLKAGIYKNDGSIELGYYNAKIGRW